MNGPALARFATLLLAAALCGCMSFNPRSLREMEAALQHSNPNVDFEPTLKFGVGPLSMNLVDFAFVHDGSVDVSKIRRADVAVYEVKGELDVSAFKVPQGSDSSCPRREVILRVMEEDEHVEMAVCIRDDEITGFSLFVLAPKEVVVIHTRGDLEALISSAVRGNAPARRRIAARDDAPAAPAPARPGPRS